MMNQFEFLSPQKLPPLSYGWSDSPWGKLFLVFAGENLFGLGLAKDSTNSQIIPYFEKRLKATLHTRNDDQSQEIAKKLGKSPIVCKAIGTPFQHQVWKALLQIPEGQTRTYSEIASIAGNPNAIRATGSAIGKNPVSILIPCHRALPKSGGVGNFLWGSHFKKSLLASESAKIFQ